MTDIIPRGFQSKINQVTSKHNAEINALRMQIEVIQFESEEDHQQHEKEIHTLNEEHQQEMTNLNEEHEKEMNKLE